MLETWLHWKNRISIDDLNVDVITRAVSMFANLKINKINEILISCSQITLKEKKSKQTYIERSSFQCASYLQVNWPRYEGTLPLHCGTALKEEASQVAAGASSWSAHVIIVIRRTSYDHVLTTCCWFCSTYHTNLMNNYIIKFNF